MDWDPVARFRERALGLASTVDEVETLAAIPAAVARYLAAHSLPLAAVCWPEFAGLDWRGAGLAVESRAARDADPVGITGAFCAIAETGTLMTVTGRDTPATLSLLPETHVAVVRKSRIVRGMEEAWQLVRDEIESSRRAPSVSSPAHRAPPTSSRPSRSARTARTACTSFSLHDKSLRCGPRRNLLRCRGQIT